MEINTNDDNFKKPDLLAYEIGHTLIHWIFSYAAIPAVNILYGGWNYNIFGTISFSFGINL